MENEKKELFRNDLLSSRFRWFPLRFIAHWLISGQHRTYQRARWIDPKFRLLIFWSGSIEKPHGHIMVFFHRLELFITTPKFIVKYMKWRRTLQTYSFNKAMNLSCPDCGSFKLLPSRGMAYEPIVYCNSCGQIVYAADPEPYIR